MSNIPFLICAYSDDRFQSAWTRCSGPTKIWPITYILAALPFLIRMVQSARRYVDSGLNTHLLNVSGCYTHRMSDVHDVMFRLESILHH